VKVPVVERALLAAALDLSLILYLCDSWKNNTNPNIKSG